MKNLLIPTTILIACVCRHSMAGQHAAPAFVPKETKTPDPLMASDTVVWAGLDYSFARMVGGNNSENDFKVPDIIFPGMLEKWNQLFLDERIERVAHALGKGVSVDIAPVTERNRTATPAQIILAPGPDDVIEKSHIDPRTVAATVQSYKMKLTNGLGLVFIVDRLVSRMIPAQFAGISGRIQPSAQIKSSEAVYIVFFNIATRQVISAERQVHGVSSGGNFRNFWFGPIKDADSSLTKYSSSPRKLR